MPGAFQKRFNAAQRGLLISLAIAVPLLAQDQSTVEWHGSIRNSAGTPIAGATVKLSGAKTSESIANPDGTFGLAALPAGPYRLSIAGHGRTISYNEAIDLAPAAPAVVITVSDRGEISVVAQQGTGASGREALSGKAVSELPLNKRDSSSLLLLAAGHNDRRERRRQLHCTIRN